MSSDPELRKEIIRKLNGRTVVAGNFAELLHTLRIEGQSVSAFKRALGSLQHKYGRVVVQKHASSTGPGLGEGVRSRSVSLRAI